MTENFKSLALSYKTAPLKVREQVSLNEAGSKQLLQFLKNYTTATEVLVISTCNRTEVYYTADRDLSHDIFRGLSLIKNPVSGFEQYFVRHQGPECIRHLF